MERQSLILTRSVRKNLPIEHYNASESCSIDQSPFISKRLATPLDPKMNEDRIESKDAPAKMV